MALTVKVIKHAKPREKAYRLSDGRGLYLQVEPNKSRYWRLAYRFNGKQKTLALGVYPDVTLKDARDLTTEAKKLVRKGIDPSFQRKLEKVAQSSDDSFRTVALEWFQNKMSGKSDRHRQRAMSILENDLFPVVGDSRIDDITGPELLVALRNIESRGAIDIAHRARGVAGQVFRYGVSSGMCQRDVSRDLRGALKEKPKTKHRAAITDPLEVGKLMIAIDEYQGTPTVCAALKLSALLFQRPGEIRRMEWTEINWEDELWSISAEKMKMERDHLVPLSKQAITVLEDIHRITGRGAYVFPSARGTSRPLSDNGVRVALRTMGYDNETMSPHGFRAMARTMLDEKLHFRVDYIEHQLAHAVKDPTGRAYNRTKFVEERRGMMQKWADYLDQLEIQVLEDNVVLLDKIARVES